MASSLSHKFFQTIDGRKIELAISITSGLVSVGLLYINPGEKPLVLASKKQEVPFGYNPQPQEIKKRVLVILDSLLKGFVSEITQMYLLNDLYDAHQVIHRVSVSLSPLWLETETKKHDRTYPKTQVITKKHLDEILESENTKELIDVSIRSVQVNGYPIEPDAVIGIETPDIQITADYSYLDRNTHDVLSDTITKHFGIHDIDRISFIPTDNVLMLAISELYGSLEQYSLIYFDAEDTTIITQASDQPLESKTITYGRAELKRQCIQEKIAPNFSQTQDVLRAYFAGSLEDSLSEKVSYVLSVEGQVLASAIQEVIKIKTPLFVISEKNGALFITRNTVEYIDDLSGVTEITAQDFISYVQSAGSFVSPSIELLALFVYITHGKTHVTS